MSVILDNTVASLDKDECTGCGACNNACPVNAISMKRNLEGFLEPVIDNSKCVNCGQCQHICPQISKPKFLAPIHAYGIRCIDEIRDKCSSGGAFGAFAKAILNNGGIVYGAAFSDNFKKLNHQKAENEEELQKLLKSKYLQSDTQLVFKEIKQELCKGREVLFAGCPCQVAGLKQYLGANNHNLYTIDILCHGVVSPMVYERFINEFMQGNPSAIVKVDFRAKELGWTCSSLLVKTDDDQIKINKEYFNAFLWGYSQRKVCFNCQYSQNMRVGDITIGDFWGIERIIPEINDNKGTSLVLINTKLGEVLYRRINEYIVATKEKPVDQIISAIQDINWALYKPGIIPANRDVFFYRLNKGASFKSAFEYASTGQYDVGIFGWWFEDNWTNYGSTLTYFALKEYVSSLGLRVCMITSPFHTREKASDFIKTHGYVMSKTYSFNDFYKHNDNIKKFLIGSDQLWFYDCYKPWGHSLFLDFVSDTKKKISYATSLGHANPKIPINEIPVLRNLLCRFSGISIRENDGVNYIKNMFGIDAVQTVDPVFLLNKVEWTKIANEAGRKTEGEYIFTYMLDPTIEKIEALKYLSMQLKTKIIAVTDKQYDNDSKVEALKDCNVIINASISELLYHIQNAKYVVTDSYHGTCFSLIFNKNFVSIINAKRGISRFNTIKELFGIEDRIVDDPINIIDNAELLYSPNYYIINQKMDKEILRSKSWLDNQLLN